jgi:hypothetical protein
MKLSIPPVITLKAGRALLLLQKSSPTTLFVAGIAGVVGTAVLASRATLKLGEILDEAENQQAILENVEGDIEGEGRKLVKVATAVKIVKLYAPTVLVGTLTIGALTGSHRVLTVRNSSLTAAYAALDQAFEKYRKHVIDEIGEEREHSLRYDLQKKEFTEDGKKVHHKVAGPNQTSIYARFFDETCSSWNPNAEINLLFLRAQQNYANDKLRARGHMFLNEVYDSLGLERSQAGSVVGWLLNPEGDNYIDFGLNNGESERVRAFVNGHEKAVLLDFNVDGLIYDKIEK